VSLCIVAQSPAWDAAIMDFIDEHCVVFDNEDENKFAYTEVHMAFRELVSKHLHMYKI
jgi:hypothetical protein